LNAHFHNQQLFLPSPLLFFFFFSLPLFFRTPKPNTSKETLCGFIVNYIPGPNMLHPRIEVEHTHRLCHWLITITVAVTHHVGGDDFVVGGHRYQNMER